MKKLEKAVAQLKEKLDLLVKINGKKDRRREKGFTLIELIAVILILGILMALVVSKILGSSNDANAKLIAKTVKDVRDATTMAKMKCLSVINTESICSREGNDARNLLYALWSDSCQVMPKNAFDVNEQEGIKVKDFKIQTDCKEGANKLEVTTDCAGNRDICAKTQEQLNMMYGEGACSIQSDGKLFCTLSL
jgi:prepilin-type N-terminal cleavage/methylation domain-containing protein